MSGAAELTTPERNLVREVEWDIEHDPDSRNLMSVLVPLALEMADQDAGGGRWMVTACKENLDTLYRLWVAGGEDDSYRRKDVAWLTRACPAHMVELYDVRSEGPKTIMTITERGRDVAKFMHDHLGYR